MTNRLRFLSIAAVVVALATAAGCAKTPATTTTTAAGETTTAAAVQTTTAQAQLQIPLPTEDEIAIFTYSSGLSDNGFFDLKAADNITLPTYLGVSLPEDILTLDTDELGYQLDTIRQEYATYEELKDRAIVDGDTVNMDYVGKVDGTEFSGGSTGGAGTSVTIGTTQYIDDFLEQLIGHKPGETFDIEVTFPTPYTSSPDLSGKDAVFTVTINYIQGEQSIPELNDQMASDYGFNTPQELIASIEQWLISNQKTDYIKDLLADASHTQIPDSVIKYITLTDLFQYQYYAQMMQITLDEYMVTYGGYDSLAAYLTANQEAYQASARYCLAIQAIAEKEGLSVDDATLNASIFGTYVENYGTAYAKMLCLQNIVVPDFVIGKAANAGAVTAAATTTAATTTAATTTAAAQ